MLRKMRLIKKEPGVYETPDGQFQIERILALDEYDAGMVVWILNRWMPGLGDSGWWQEIADGMTKAECVDYLVKYIERYRLSEGGS